MVMANSIIEQISCFCYFGYNIIFDKMRKEHADEGILGFIRFWSPQRFYECYNFSYT